MEQKSIVHNFGQSLKISMDLNGEVDWLAVYQGLWPEMIACVRIDANCEWQKRGVDRLILLPGGKELTVDEKVRPARKNGAIYDDFLVEEWSDFRRQKPGWTLDKSKWCDYVAYAIISVQKCYLLPFELLRLTCTNNLPRWKEEAQTRNRKPIDVLNEGWTTRCWPVRWVELFHAMDQQMMLSYGAKAPVKMPKPVSTSDGRTLFDWQDGYPGNSGNEEMEF